MLAQVWLRSGWKKAGLQLQERMVSFARLQPGDELPDRQRADRVVVALEYLSESMLDVDGNPGPIPSPPAAKEIQ